MSEMESAEDQPMASAPLGKALADFSPERRPLAPLEAGLVSFDRHELRQIFDLYGRKVAAGEWRDYALDFSCQRAAFYIYRRAAEFALYRIEKNPKLARRQGLYCVITATGLILKRGSDLTRVLAAIDMRLKLVPS